MIAPIEPTEPIERISNEKTDRESSISNAYSSLDIIPPDGGRGWLVVFGSFLVNE